MRSCGKPDVEAPRLPVAPLLTAGEEQLLIRQAQEGDPRARQRMMEANVRLVISIARRYTCTGLAFEDLVQEGVIGLLQAIDKFDVVRGTRFSTYATYWIRQTIARAIEKQDRLIRLPISGGDSTRRLERAQIALLEQLGRPPTPEELAQETGLSVRMVQTLAKVSHPPASLDAFVGDEADTTLGELLADASVQDMEACAIGELDRTLLLAKVRALEPKERWVIEQRFGLLDGRPRTLREVAEQLTMSREGVRHVQVRGLKRLRTLIGEETD